MASVRIWVITKASIYNSAILLKHLVYIHNNTNHNHCQWWQVDKNLTCFLFAADPAYVCGNSQILPSLYLRKTNVLDSTLPGVRIDVQDTEMRIITDKFCGQFLFLIDEYRLSNMPCDGCPIKQTWKFYYCTHFFVFGEFPVVVNTLGESDENPVT